MSDTPVIPIARAADKQELEDASHSIAESLQGALPEGVSFALFLYRDDGSVKYISSGSLEDADTIMARWRAKVFGGPLATDPERAATVQLRRLRMWLVNTQISSCKEDAESIVTAAMKRIEEVVKRYRQDVPPGRRVL